MKSRIVRCPQCGTMSEYKVENSFRPFCSDRCKLIDLGAWAEERYAIAGSPVLVDESLAHSGEDSMDKVANPDRRLDS